MRYRLRRRRRCANTSRTAATPDQDHQQTRQRAKNEAMTDLNPGAADWSRRLSDQPDRSRIITRSHIWPTRRLITHTVPLDVCDEFGEFLERVCRSVQYTCIYLKSAFIVFRARHGREYFAVSKSHTTETPSSVPMVNPDERMFSISVSKRPNTARPSCIIYCCFVLLEKCACGQGECVACWAWSG